MDKKRHSDVASLKPNRSDPADAKLPEDKKLRHPAGGGYARGEETRRRIIEASIEVFGERGFDAATTREIAQRAQVNPPALQYYFENKEGLYRACAEDIACEFSTRFDPVAERVLSGIAAGAAGEDAIELFCELQDTLIEHLLVFGERHSRRLFLAREQSGHSPDDGERAKQAAGNRMHRAGTAVLSRLSGQSEEDPEVKMRVMMLFGQMLVFHTARRPALAAMGWTDFDAEKVSFLKRMLRTQTQSLLRTYVR